MKVQIRHRRLYAFYNSKVLNCMVLLVWTALMLVAYDADMFGLGISVAATAGAFFIAYSLWLWIKKPETIVINRWLSEAGLPYMIYFIVVLETKPSGALWYIFPAVCMVGLLFVAMTNKKDENFIITNIP